MKKGTRHEWREQTTEGETLFVRAVHFGGEWEFFEQYTGEEDWTALSKPPLERLITLLERLENKYRRHRLGWETVEKMHKTIASHPHMKIRLPLLGLLEKYDEKWPDETRTTTRYRDFVRRHPNCFERSLLTGHVTGSSWIIDPSETRTLLTHHRKLDRWLQPGGHADGNPAVLEVALSEAREETGIEEFEVIGEGLFDLDIHPIPERKEVPAHNHFDVRYLLKAKSTKYIVSDESHDLAWVRLEDLESYTEEESMLRMRDKCLAQVR